jgi:hypothetical protein
MKATSRFALILATMALAVCVNGAAQVSNPNFNITTFANGTAVNSTQPDPVTVGDGSIWISYTNGADSTGQHGSSTVVRYSPNGTVENQWTIAGNVDGLRVAPDGLVWALQNNDGNSKLTTINPTSSALTHYTYGNTYTNVPNRGFDDAAYTNGNTFLSETNPASPNDAIVVRLTTNLSSPLQIAGILNSQFMGLNMATGQMMQDNILDSDSLILRPNGDLALTGEADKQIVFIHNPGLSNQSESFLNLLDTNGQTISGKPDDTAFPTSSAGYFFLTDTGANKVYRIYANGLSTNDVFIDVGTEFGQLNLSTGVVTPILTGLISPHGLEFVSATPEPSTLASLLGGILCCGGAIVRRMRTAAS